MVASCNVVVLLRIASFWRVQFGAVTYHLLFQACVGMLVHCLQLARGIVAIGSMSAAAITRTATAVGGAIHNYSNNLMNQIPPLSQPLTVSQSYVSR